MTLGHAVDKPGEEHAQGGHVELAPLEAPEPLELVRQGGSEHLVAHVEREAIVPRRHRRVGGEHAAVPQGVEVDVAGCADADSGAGAECQQADWHQGGVALVHVEGGRLVAERGQHGRAPQPQHGLLREPQRLVAGVEPVGDGLVLGIVLG